MSGHAEVEDQIERLKQGNTLPENEVKALCEKVRRRRSERSEISATLSACCDNLSDNIPLRCWLRIHI